MEQKPVLDIHEVPKPGKWLLLSIQHLFAMFGATVLVPFLTGLSPAVALISSGLGTLAFLLITKGQVPAYLGSSFAFIAPIITAKAAGGPGAAMLGGMMAGLVYMLIALAIKKSGSNWIMNLLPPIVVGPVVMVIGLGLAHTAVDMAMNNADGKYSFTHFSVALVTLAITIICSIFGRGFLSIIPVLIGIIGGYIFAYFQGLVDLKPVIEAKWFDVPDFVVPFVTYTPEFSWKIVLVMVPVAIVTVSEHIGHQIVLGNVINKDLIEKPGLHRSIMGDGIATFIASAIGGPPNTTYGENIGVLAITRAYSVYLFVGSAILAIMFGFIGKISALIHSIPTPVMGGVSILLFGVIASSGLRMMVDEKTDFGDKRNLVIASVILVIGIGGAVLHIGQSFQVEGMALAAIVGVILNLVLPELKQKQQQSKNIAS
ncbi:uracil permease [Bacillus sp. AFS018417]|uniref:solute carrier family 23 protein n=1 Tax=unclassified Bacillus (in: firmicutes) TaxID=185979 RepID=UPI000BF8566D|nr:MULTISPECIES: solute carrier family 23 protein [unclassified Bacillus (in: firmicutes)]MCP1124805.1 NCS2 family nucleobase:cation symporter [Bacillus sp. 3103sda1]PEZ10224.1 uracil permease [Bacillus sp. AFS018417]